MEFIRFMFERIEVHAGAERGKPDVVLIGVLAQILSVTQQSKTAASSGDGGWVSVVAGAGFGQDPTMLELRKAV